MTLDDAGITFLNNREGCKLVGYGDTRGIPTIGVGHTGFVDNVPVYIGQVITQEQSNQLLEFDLKSVYSAINNYVKVPLTQSQFNALCSLVFNIGVRAFSGSTLLKMLNAGNYSGAADQFLAWKRAGSSPDILLPRRRLERELFLS